MKKKGSSIVFAVLMLAFFLALSLNIYFLARKKAERASIKVQGEVVTNNIDIASSLGYQELKLAEEFVRIGFLYGSSHPHKNNNDTYSMPNSGDKPLYIDPSTGDFNTNQRYAGIQINNFIDYFSSEWNHGNSVNQKLIIGEEASGGKIVSRIWQSAGVESSLTPLWSLSAGALSVGGYSYNSSVSSAIPTTDGIYSDLTAIYEKFIYLDSTNISQSVFKIEVKETFDYTKDGSDITISNRDITEFIIRAID